MQMPHASIEQGTMVGIPEKVNAVVEGNGDAQPLLKVEEQLIEGNRFRKEMQDVHRVENSLKVQKLRQECPFCFVGHDVR